MARACPCSSQCAKAGNLGDRRRKRERDKPVSELQAYTNVTQLNMLYHQVSSPQHLPLRIQPQPLLPNRPHPICIRASHFLLFSGSLSSSSISKLPLPPSCPLLIFILSSHQPLSVSHPHSTVSRFSRQQGPGPRPHCSLGHWCHVRKLCWFTTKKPTPVVTAS